ncbi:MAG: hypothetical protein JWM21_2751 [Acidobacteria bacterium]|nr:hypothetical protein [Acidobacteriota bacterium]
MKNTLQAQNKDFFHRWICIACAAFVVGVLPGNAFSQNPPVHRTDSEDDVVRVSTKLVQTSVTVTDKKGRFVDNLSRDDFELLVDGKTQPISLFHVVRTATPLLTSGSNGSPATASPVEETSGRTVLIFVDDLHLSAESIGRTRKMLDYYIEQQMGYGDQVLIASPSGQIGFLQQLTDSKEALHAAVARLKFRSTTARDVDRPPMSEYQALSIERGDEQQLAHFAAIAIAEIFSGLRRTNAAAARDAAERLVHTRARRILAQSNNIVRATLATLENVMRSVIQLPGRKLVVMVSDGFLLNNQGVEVSDKLRDISDAALRAGAVIYSIQASGLNTSFADAASTDTMDENGDTGRAPLGEDSALQAPLAELPAATGGRALLNANNLNPAIDRALDETAQYYLLAWRPDEDLLRERRFHRVKVVLKDHRELSARVNSGFFSETSSTSAAAGQPPVVTAPQEQLRAAIANVFYINSLQTNLTTSYMQVAAGPQLTILTQVPLEDANESDHKERAADIVGVVLDDNGKTAGSFGDHLSANDNRVTTSLTQHRSITYLSQVIVKPGLYEVRVAARDSTTGEIGRATRWIQVPDISSGKLSLSSLLLGERESGAAGTDLAKLPKAQLKVDNHFNRKSRLRVLTYVYNAATPGGPTPRIDIEVQLRRQNKLLVSSQPRRLEIVTREDFHEFPFAEELSLAQLSSGWYVLRVIATNRLNKETVSRETGFRVE